MSSEEGQISHLNRSQINPDSTPLSDAQEDLSKLYDNQCEDCLKSSLKKENGRTMIDTDLAIQKIDLLKDVAQDGDVKQKLTHLIQNLQSQDHFVSKTSHLKEIIQTAFNKTDTQTAAQVSVTLNSDSANPFKKQNPFGPKPIPKTKDSEQTDNKQTFSKITDPDQNES